jgi:polysaccharide pyruvyl transferase WcaK-like protein
MVYKRPGSWPSENLEEYRRYIELWARLASDRVARGDRVHFFTTDPADMSAVQDVWDLLSDVIRAGCSIERASSPNSLLDFFRRLDVVISSRLHGVLLAIVAGRPVLALSHERKVRAVMNDAGVSSFCADLNTVNMDQIEQHLTSLTGQLDTCARRLRDYSASARSAVQQQDEIIPTLLRRR